MFSIFLSFIRNEGYIYNDLDLKIYFIPINGPHLASAPT